MTAASISWQNPSMVWLPWLAGHLPAFKNIYFCRQYILALSSDNKVYIDSAKPQYLACWLPVQLCNQPKHPEPFILSITSTV